MCLAEQYETVQNKENTVERLNNRKDRELDVREKEEGKQEDSN